jgi:hypothetical protein
MPARRLLLLLLLPACAPLDASFAPTDDGAPADDGTPGGGDTDAVADTTCSARVAWINPEADAEHVPVDAAITVGFDTALPEGAAWGVTVAGVDGRAELSPDRRVATFTPDEPLADDQDYDVTAQACGDAAEATFRTLGAPIDPDTLVGRTWSLDLADLTFVAPAAGSTVPRLVGVPAVLAHVADEDDGPHLQLRLAFRAGSHVVPIPCAPPADAGLLDLTGNPRFVTEASTLVVSWQGTDLIAQELRVEGIVDDGGRELDSLSFRGLFDVRPVEVLTGLSGTCADAEADGHPCEPCSDGVVACLPTLATDGVAHEVASADFDVDAADFLADLLGLCD